MKKTAWMILLSALCLVPGTARAEADADVSGSVTIGVMGVDQDGDSAKFDEYRHKDDGTYGEVELRAFLPGYYLWLEGEKHGDADESFGLRGGRFGQFKYSLFYDETPHHLSSGASTFYAGAGGDYLANTGVSADPSRWNEVDYRRDRQSYGLDGELSLGSPYYLRFGASEKNTEGIYPLMGNSTISGFGNTTELPGPVDWDETKGFVEGGYRSRGLVASVKAEFSSFDNADEEFFWEDDIALSPAIGPDATTGPPDNDFWKVSGQLVWKMPSLSSSLALRATHSRLESDRTIRSTVASDTPAGASSIAVEPADFNGDITYSSFDAGWSLVPADSLSLEVFFKYLDKNNDNTVLDFASGGSVDETEVFDYSKWSTGLEASYALARRTSLDGGYSFTTVDRSGRLDNEGSDDHLLFLQVRSRSWEALELRGRYEYLGRSGDFSPKETGGSPADSEFIRNFLRRFDVADQTRHSVDLEAATSLADVGLAVEFGWSDSDYDKTEIGLTGVQHYDVYVTADYAMGKAATLGAYFGFENDQTDVDSRNFSPGLSADPASGNVGSAYNWTESKEFDTIAFGLNLKVPLGRKLLFSASWDWSDVDGKAEFSAGRSAPLLDLDKVDDYTKQELTADLTYRFTSRMSLRFGYLYEKFDLADEQWDGYGLQPNTSTLLTGAYADSDYEGHTGFLETTYHF